MMLSVTRLQSVEWQDERQIGKNLEGIRQGTVKVLPGICLEGLRKAIKNSPPPGGVLAKT
jgi:hypothetical protein